jgi:hypothetical protein
MLQKTFASLKGVHECHWLNTKKEKNNNNNKNSITCSQSQRCWMKGFKANHANRTNLFPFGRLTKPNQASFQFFMLELSWTQPEPTLDAKEALMGALA